MGVFRSSYAVKLAVFALGLAPAAQAVDVVGTQVTVGWTAASGPVSGYYVIVARDAGQAQVESVTVGTNKTLAGTVGQTLTVQVAAFAQDGVAGPVSPPSSPITFVASSGGGGTTPPPAAAAEPLRLRAAAERRRPRAARRSPSRVTSTATGSRTSWSRPARA